MKRTPVEKSPAKRPENNCRLADWPGAFRLTAGIKPGIVRPAVFVRCGAFPAPVPADHPELPSGIRDVARTLVGLIDSLRPANGDLRAWGLEVVRVGHLLIEGYDDRQRELANATTVPAPLAAA